MASAVTSEFSIGGLWDPSFSRSSCSVPRSPDLEIAFAQPKPAGLPAHFYFIISAVFHYLGPACDVLLFARLNVLGVAWLRIASAALVLAVWKRPWQYVSARNRDEKRTILSFGLVLAAMNVSFYVAINRLPLGTVAAVEFLAPVSIAAAGARTKRNVFALVVASLGVCLLTHFILRVEWIGFLFALANCGLFALYILFGHRAAAGGGKSGIESLSAAMCVALVAVTPVGIFSVVPALHQPILLLAGAGVGICSSVVPYVCDQLAMARLKRSTFALLLSLLPAVATVTGCVILRQIPNPIEVVGIGLVMIGVAIQNEGTR